MHLECLLLLFLLYHRSKSLLYYEQSNDSSSKVRECAIEISKKYITEDIIVTPINYFQIGDYIFDSGFLFEITESHNRSFLVVNITEGTLDFRLWSKGNLVYLIEFDDISTLRQLLDVKLEHNLWETYTKFIVASKALTSPLPHISAVFLDRGILNFILLFPLEEDPQTVSIYSWTPSSNSFCFSTSSTTNSIGSYSERTLHMKAKPFFNKLPDNYFGCNVKVGILEWPPYIERSNHTENHYDGIEIDLLNTIVEKLGVNVTFIESEIDDDWGDVHENGTVTGMFEDLWERKYDIVAGSYGPTKERHMFFEISQAYWSEHAVWIVPHAQAMPAWRFLIEALGWRNAVYLSSIIFICTLNLYVLSSTSVHEAVKLKKIRNCFLAVYCFTLGFPVTTLPRTVKARVLTSLLMIHSLIQISKYSSHLTSFMTNQYYNPQISTIEEVLKKNLKISILDGVEKYVFVDDDNPVVAEISKRYVPCVDYDYCLYEIAFHGNVALAASKLPTEYVSEQYFEEDKPLLYILQQEIASYSLHFIMRKRYFLRDSINMWISRLSAVGLIEKTTNEVHCHIKKHANRQNFSQHKVMTMMHLQTAFILLIVGLLMSGIVFIAEVYYQFRSNQYLY